MSRTKIFSSLEPSIIHIKQALFNNEDEFFEIHALAIKKIIEQHPTDLFAVLEFGIKCASVSEQSLDKFISCLNYSSFLEAELEPLLMFAIEKAALGKVKWLIGKGANSSYVDENNATPLLTAANIDCDVKVQLDIVKTLLDHGAESSLYVWDIYGDNPFISACVANNGKLLELFCKYDVSSLLLPQHNHVALWYINDPEIAKLLVDKGANVNEKREEYNVLNHAAILPDSKLLEYYLSICDKSLINPANATTTPLEEAILASSFQNISILLQNGAKISQKTLDLVAEIASVEVAELILANNDNSEATEVSLDGEVQASLIVMET